MLVFGRGVSQEILSPFEANLFNPDQLDCTRLAGLAIRMPVAVDPPQRRCSAVVVAGSTHRAHLHQRLRPDRMGSFAARGAIELASVPAAAILTSTHSLRRFPLQSRENLRVRLPPCQKHWRPALSYSERNDASRAKLSTAKRALPRCTVSSPPCDQSQRGRGLGLPVGAVSSASSAAPATWWGIVLANLREAAGAIPAPGLDLASLCASSAASPMSLGACCP